jgi:hypothetical protein
MHDNTTCKIDGCNSKVSRRGWCNAHYLKWYRHGDPNRDYNSETEITERFWSKVDAFGDCWEWLGSKTAAGYGVFSERNCKVYAHRKAYTVLIGPIPDSLVIDHLCRNVSCVNPDHLEAVTQGVNVKRGIAPMAVNAKKTHCPRGHEYTQENTYRKPRTNYRECRQCTRVNAASCGGAS